MTPTPANTLAQQKKQAEEQKRVTDSLILKQKEILRVQIADFDKQIALLQTQRTRTAADLQALG